MAGCAVVDLETTESDSQDGVIGFALAASHPHLFGSFAALYEQTARLIPDSTLTLYPGKGHLGVLSDPRLAPDTLTFAARSTAT